MKELTIIVPLVEYTEDMKGMFETSLGSVLAADVNEEVSLIFVGPSSSIKVVKETEWGNRDVLYLENDKNFTPQYQINKAVKDVKTSYFTVLEFDDKFNSFWFEEVETHLKHFPDTSLFLPLIEAYDFQKPEIGAIAYANEAVWASAFSEELGYLDLEALKNHYNFIVSGGVFKKSDFVSVGGLKNTLEVFFWYELLLRLCHNGKRIYVIPKVGYEHMVNRDGNLTSLIQQKSQEEIDFWFNTAQEEYLYKTDRKKTYNS